MADRITNAHLEQLCKVINRAMGTAEKPYTKDDSAGSFGGQYRRNAGNYYISRAYGGVSLEQMCRSGGSRDVITCGHVPKRDLYNRMRAFLDGVEAEQHRQKGAQKDA